MKESYTDFTHTPRIIEKEPLVSVICFVYNRERYIAETIESVLGQTYKNIELVILDDGSTDKTGAIIKSYLPHRNIKYFYQDNLSKKLGTKDIKFDTLNNRCVELSSGDYICVIGADDIYLPERIEKQLAEFKTFPQLDISFCNGRTIDERGLMLGSDFRHPKALKFTKYNLLRWLFTDNFISHPSVMMKRTAFDLSGGYGGGFGCDYHFWLKAAGKLHFKYLDEFLWYYRIHEDSASTSTKNNDFRIKGTLDVLEEYYKTLSIEDFYPEIAFCADQVSARYSAHLDFGNSMLAGGFFLLPRFALLEYKAALEAKEDGLEALNNLALVSLLTGDREASQNIFNGLRVASEHNDVLRNNINTFDNSAIEELRSVDYRIFFEGTGCSELQRMISMVEKWNNVIPGSTFESALSAGGNGQALKRPSNKGLTSIIVSISDFNKKTKQCVESIRAHVKERYEILVIKKEGSEAPPWLKRVTSESNNFTIIDTANCANYAAMCNKGIQMASGQHVLILDPRTVILEKTLSSMLECIERSPSYGIVVPLSNISKAIQRILPIRHMLPDSFFNYMEASCGRNRYRAVETYEIDCFCVLAKKTLFESIGLLNEKIEIPHFVLNDFRMRALIEGQQTVIACDSCVYLNDDDSRKERFERHFQEQWGKFNPHSEAGQKLSPLIAIKKARSHHRKDLLEEAIQDIMKGIEFAPENPSLYYCLAEILLENKLYSQSIEAIEALPEKEKDSRQALEILGYCDYHLGHIDKAMSYSGKVLSVCADSPKSINLQGLVAMQSGDREKAEALFRQVISIDPSFADPYMHIGAMKWQDNEQSTALDLIEKGFILAPETADFMTTYHSAIISLGELERGETVLREACGLFPENRKLAFLLIGVLLQQNSFIKAMEMIENALLAFGVDDDTLSAALTVREKVGPCIIDGPIGKKGTLSICMIVKNEEEHIIRSLASLKPIADEIVVIDTGSTDRTKDIVTVFGCRLYELEWADDFSEARNFSLSMARGQWVLVHDADETISARDHEKLRHVLNRQKHDHVAYTLVTRNYISNASFVGWTPNTGEYPDDEEGTGWFPSPKVRLFMNDRRFRFANPVHEVIEPSLRRAGVKIGNLDIPVHHYGKLNEEKTKLKAEAYYLLGRKKLDGTNANLIAIRELAIQAGELGKYEEAIGLWERYLEIHQSDTQAYINMSKCCLETKQFERALAFARKAVEFGGDLKESILCYAVASLVAGNLEDARTSLESLLDSSPDYPPAMAAIAAAYSMANNRERSITILHKIRGMGYNCSVALFDLAEKFIAAGMTNRALAVLNLMKDSGNRHPGMPGLLDVCYNSSSENVKGAAAENN